MSNLPAKQLDVDWREAVRAATLVAGTLATDFENGDTIDGVVLATGDRILIKNQAAGAENGIYVVNATGAPTRAKTADATAATGTLRSGAAVFVSEGSQGGQGWWLTTANPITVGVTAQTWAQFAGPGAAAETWAATLAAGNTSGGTDAVISSGDSITGVDSPTVAGTGYTVRAGDHTGALAGGQAGGDLAIRAGDTDATGSAQAGSVTIDGGDSTGDGTGGNVTITGGASTANEEGGGGVTVQGGTAADGNGGEVVVRGENGSATRGGGTVQIQSGGGGSGSGSGGDIEVEAFAGQGTGLGGDVRIDAGNGGVGGGAGGNVEIEAGGSPAGGGDGGDVTITPGDASGGGDDGVVIIDGLTWPEADGSANAAITTDGAGVLGFSAGAVGTERQEQVTSETVTGTDTALADTLNNTPVNALSVKLALNGLVQSQGAGRDYTVSGQTITWLASTGTAVNLVPADVIDVWYESSD